MRQYCLRKIKMYPDEWAAIDQLAVTLGAHVRHSPVQAANWASLVRGIARGDHIVTAAKRNLHLERVDAAIASLKAEEEAHKRQIQAEYKQLSILEREPA